MAEYQWADGASTAASVYPSRTTCCTAGDLRRRPAAELRSRFDGSDPLGGLHGNGRGPSMGYPLSN